MSYDDDFEGMTRAIKPEARFKEIPATGHEQIRSAVAGLITAIAGLIVTATICGALTWIGWAIPAAVRWWS